ncbi:polysaccharide deacetylase [Sphingobacteriaceae bacterium]|nr:polysaccharide deacetylase [Sphingobacteriaceae bacterium]
MLRHRNILILFQIIFVALILLDIRYNVSWIIYVLTFLIFSLIEFYGAYFIHSNFHLTAVCKTETAEKIIALSFDDGPVDETEKVLKVLKEFDVKATFFCIGQRIAGKETILEKINSEGHLIGNHSYSHSFFFDFKTKSAFIKDLELCNNLVFKVIQKKPNFFRPPYGVTTPALSRATKTMNFDVIGWNIRSLDTSIQNKETVLQRIKDRLQPGSILLMHDTVTGIDLVLKQVLIHLKEQNYRVVPLDQLIQKKAYA